MSLEFAITETDGRARAGSVTLRGRRFDTPAFMPVATRGSVKCLDMQEVKALGYRIILMNAYHLHQRPGEDIVASRGGVHGFTGYDGVILTDSGGYQLYSFGRGARLDEDGAVVFRNVLLISSLNCPRILSCLSMFASRTTPISTASRLL